MACTFFFIGWKSTYTGGNGGVVYIFIFSKSFLLLYSEKTNFLFVYLVVWNICFIISTNSLLMWLALNFYQSYHHYGWHTRWFWTIVHLQHLWKKGLEECSWKIFEGFPTPWSRWSTLLPLANHLNDQQRWMHAPQGIVLGVEHRKPKKSWR